MPRAKPNRPIHPLRMADALVAMNQAASLFAAKVDAVELFLRQPNISHGQIEKIHTELASALTEFRAAMWPEEE